MPKGKAAHPKLKRSAGKMRSLILDKRAVSVALSTLIITAGVVAFGIAILYWAYSWGGIANQAYSGAVSSSQSAIAESLGFEYISYSNNNLTVYLINCGMSKNVTIVRAYLWNSSGQLIGSYPNASAFPPLYYTATKQPIPSNALDVGDEGYFTLSQLSLDASTYYTLRLVTKRGSNFDQAFSTP
jgi:hypothetical protein